MANFLSFQPGDKPIFPLKVTVLCITQDSICFLLQEGDISKDNIVYFIDSQVVEIIYDKYFKSFLAILWLTTCTEEYTYIHTRKH